MDLAKKKKMNVSDRNPQVFIMGIKEKDRQELDEIEKIMLL